MGPWGLGGSLKLGSVAITHSVQLCAQMCNQDRACVGFVYMYSQGKCWKRAAINLNTCEVGVQGQESSAFTTFTKDQYVKMSSGTCPEDRQVSKEECLVAAQKLGSDKTTLHNVNVKGLRGRPAGCTIHDWGNVEWWGPSDNAPCGSLNYNCVCQKKYVKMSSGSCPKDRQVSKEECLAAAQELGSDKTKLANVNEKGLRGRPAGCTMHNWGNVEWWGPSDNAPCGSLNYNCVCKW